MAAGRYTRGALLKGAAVAGGAAMAVPALLGAQDGSSSGSVGAAKRGGKLRVAMVGGGATETLDPNAAVPNIDSARASNLFDRLVHVRPDGTLSMDLARIDGAERGRHQVDGAAARGRRVARRLALRPAGRDVHAQADGRTRRARCSAPTWPR